MIGMWRNDRKLNVQLVLSFSVQFPWTAAISSTGDIFAKTTTSLLPDWGHFGHYVSFFTLVVLVCSMILSTCIIGIIAYTVAVCPSDVNGRLTFRTSAKFFEIISSENRIDVPLFTHVRRSSFNYLLPSSRQYLSNDDCPEDKTEDYQNCSVLFTVYDSCAQWYAHTCEQFLKLTVDLGFL